VKIDLFDCKVLNRLKKYLYNTREHDNVMKLTIKSKLKCP